VHRGGRVTFNYSMDYDYIRRRRPFINEGIIPRLLSRQRTTDGVQQPQFNLGNWLKLAVSVWTMTHLKKAPGNPDGTPYHFRGNFFVVLLLFIYLYLFPLLLLTSYISIRRQPIVDDQKVRVSIGTILNADILL